MRTQTEIARQAAVVIPCYNAERWVARTVRSVQAQGDVVAGIIVVDDGSTDASLQVLRPLAEAGEITLITGPNRGGCHARNLGLARVTAPFVMFLDADDLLEGCILCGSVRAGAAADLILSRMEIRYLDGAPSAMKGPFGPPQRSAREVFAGWIDGDWVNPSAVVWRTAFLRGLGGWDESLAVGQDGELVLRGLLNDARLACNHAGSGVYHRGIDGSVSMAGGLTAAKLEGQIDLIARMNRAAADKGWEDALGRNHAALYYLARKSFAAGHVDLGRRALALLQARGSRRHYGTRAHVAVAGVLGLERKVRYFGA